VSSPIDGGAEAHRVTLEMVQPVAAEVPVGTAVALQVKAADAAGRDLRGGVVEIIAADRKVTATLIDYRDGVNTTDELALTAPEQLGAFSWRLFFPRQDLNEVAYAESALAVAFRTTPHQTSLAVWAVPSPVRIGARFSIKVGAKSSGGCALDGAQVEIRDQTGADIARGTLGAAPWPDTGALYWAEINLTAPPQDGMFVWSAAFAAQDLKLPHAGASTTFSFAVVKPPEHRLTIEAIERETGTPIEDAQVSLGPYRAATDGAGMASLDAPAGPYRLAVWKPGFEAAPTILEIAADTLVQIELKRLPEEVRVWD
jgi:hypothetical protein